MTLSSVDLIHENMLQRQSVGLLADPAPNKQQLDRAFQAALTAPDHHRLKPTRFVIVSEEKRQEFGHLLSQSMADFEDIDPAQVERVRAHPLRAPLLVLALTELTDHPKVPHYEQILSTGAAVQNFLLSLQSQGFSTIWRTGAVVESNTLKKALGLQVRDYISGIIYIGTTDKALQHRTDHSVEGHISIWQNDTDLEAK
ncbi:nitroreductase [Acinetobacter sp. B5B]|uniref:nitroreductase family protein n=1 Tax=Acinetobacter baretiae TaxID=2605383 RepID=UPI0018C23926|nr:nitroreductase [Acinetobacter baretiae]MBF7682132.1 nitroreductase [Acinetobacter baretiae]MBF7684625.1 nitroreductase [Acinetobacter baretiae]